MSPRSVSLLLSAIILSAVGAAGQAPVIDTFTPTSGHIGTSVILSGANFSPTPSDNMVYFGAVRAVVTAATTGSLVVSAQAGATYQPLTVTTGGLTGSSKRPFIVTFDGTQSFQTDTHADFSTDTDTPHALIVGDLDGDGKTDVAITATFRVNSSVGLFHNTSSPGALGSGSFERRASLYLPYRDGAPQYPVASAV